MVPSCTTEVSGGSAQQSAASLLESCRGRRGCCTEAAENFGELRVQGKEFIKWGGGFCREEIISENIDVSVVFLVCFHLGKKKKLFIFVLINIHMKNKNTLNSSSFYWKWFTGSDPREGLETLKDNLMFVSLLHSVCDCSARSISPSSLVRLYLVI